MRRNIYQSMLQAFHHGRIIEDPFNKRYELGPNLDLVPKVNDAYETLMQEDEKNRDHIAKAHRNFLKDAVYFLYTANRMGQAAKWFKQLGEKYPDKPIIENLPDSLPKTLTLDEYAVAVVQIDVNETSQARVTAAVQGLLTRAYYDLAIGQDDRYVGQKLIAQKVYENYREKNAIVKSNIERTGLPAFDVLNRAVLNDLLDPQNGVPFAMRATLRTQLGMSAETNLPPAAVNSTNPPPAAVTNAVENPPGSPAAN